MTTHVLPITLGWATVIDAIHMDTWKRLDPAVQDLLTNEYQKLEKEIYEKVKTETEDAYRCLSGQKPCNDPGSMRDPLTIVEVSPEDVAAYKAIVKSAVLPAWAKALRRRLRGRMERVRRQDHRRSTGSLSPWTGPGPRDG